MVQAAPRAVRVSRRGHRFGERSARRGGLHRSGRPTDFAYASWRVSNFRSVRASPGSAASRQYDAFGNVAAVSGTWNGPFGFAGNWGYQEDGDSGLQLLGHRYYDPSTGRFLTRDPIKDGRNWYGYCANSPLTAVDPEGLARVYLSLRRVGGTFAYHTYLIVQDESSGDTWTVGGGPENRDGSGILTDKSGPTGKGNYEGLPVRSPIPDDAIQLLNDDFPGAAWFNKLNHIGGEIQATEISYSALNNNSNAFTFTVIRRAGLVDNYYDTGLVGVSDMPWHPEGYHWAPGSGIILGRR
ncbi:MAG: RHS repeat-associated core domain-containing protein [Fimbriimonadaceae bacterium]|nr:RHS repeat-associated core domain-containing protein [Fimbriimonadaceae bacterium]